MNLKKQKTFFRTSNISAFFMKTVNRNIRREAGSLFQRLISFQYFDRYLPAFTVHTVPRRVVVVVSFAAFRSPPSPSSSFNFIPLQLSAYSVHERTVNSIHRLSPYSSMSSRDSHPLHNGYLLSSLFGLEGGRNFKGC